MSISDWFQGSSLATHMREKQRTHTHKLGKLQASWSATRAFRRQPGSYVWDVSSSERMEWKSDFLLHTWLLLETCSVHRPSSLFLVISPWVLILSTLCRYSTSTVMICDHRKFSSFFFICELSVCYSSHGFTLIFFSFFLLLDLISSTWVPKTYFFKRILSVAISPVQSDVLLKLVYLWILKKKKKKQQWVRTYW